MFYGDDVDSKKRWAMWRLRVLKVWLSVEKLWGRLNYPTKDMPLWRKIVLWVHNVQALCGAFEIGVVREQGAASTCEKFLRPLGLERVTNTVFVGLFWGSRLHTFFKIERFPVGQNVEVVRAHNDEYGTLYFGIPLDTPSFKMEGSALTAGSRVEGGRHLPLPVYWRAPGADMRGMLGKLWEELGGRISATTNTVVTEGEAAAATHWWPMPPSRDRLFASSAARLEAFRHIYRGYRAKKKSRTYMFIGPPGTGKTTFVSRLAELEGARLLMLRAKDLFAMNPSDMRDLFEAFSPDILLVEDLDHVSNPGENTADTLVMLSQLPTLCPGVALFLTINDLERLDPAMYRARRVNQIETFEAPGAGEAREILETYLRELGVEREVNVDNLLLELDGATGADLYDVAEACLEASDMDVLHMVRQRKKAEGRVRAGPASTRFASAQLAQEKVAWDVKSGLAAANGKPTRG